MPTPTPDDGSGILQCNYWGRLMAQSSGMASTWRLWHSTNCRQSIYAENAMTSAASVAPFMGVIILNRFKIAIDKLSIDQNIKWNTALYNLFYRSAGCDR